MTAPTTDPAHIRVVRTLQILMGAVVLLGLTAIYTWARVGGIENSNRSSRCQSYALREKHAHDADLTHIDRALLHLARKNADDCKGEND